MKLLDEIVDEPMGDMGNLVSFFENSGDVSLEMSAGPVDDICAGEDFLKSLWAEDIGDSDCLNQITKLNDRKSNDIILAEAANDSPCLDSIKVKQEPVLTLKCEENQHQMAKDMIIDSECNAGKSPRDAARAARRLAVKARRAKRKASSISNSNEKCETEDVSNNLVMSISTSQDMLVDEGLDECDPNSKDAKKQRRLIRNRMSAQLHRERKKAYVDQLEAKLQDKDKSIAKLMEEIMQLKKENQQLRAKANQEIQKSSSQTQCDSAVCLSPPSSPADATDGEDGSGSNSSSPFRPSHSDADRDEGIFRKKSVAMMMAMVISVAYIGNTAHLIGNVAKSRNLLKLESPEAKSVDSDIFSKIFATARMLTTLEGSQWEELNLSDVWDFYSDEKGSHAKEAVNPATLPHNESSANLRGHGKYESQKLQKGCPQGFGSVFVKKANEVARSKNAIGVALRNDNGFSMKDETHLSNSLSLQNQEALQRDSDKDLSLSFLFSMNMLQDRKLGLDMAHVDASDFLEITCHLTRKV